MIEIIAVGTPSLGVRSYLVEDGDMVRAGPHMRVRAPATLGHVHAPVLRAGGAVVAADDEFDRAARWLFTTAG